jgi:hypothetical protein
MNPMPHWYTSLRAHESSNEAIHSFPLESSMKFFGPFTLVVSLLFPCALIAQSTDASLTGLIDDPQKKVIPGVSVTAINTQTGVKTATSTNGDGQYVLEGLPPGTYRVEVDKQGFKGIIEAGLTLHVQDIVQINFHMALGSMSETLTVNAGDVNVDTTDGTISTVIDHTTIENMPLNGKDLTTLFELTPGTLLNAGGGESAGGGFSVDGQRPTANYVTVDGASANAYITSESGPNNNGAGIATSAAGGTSGILPIDAIEEYRMDTSTYTAENGRSPGGQVQVRTRSGTNEFHGTLFEDFRNQVLDANDWFSNYDDLPQTPLRMNEFGGTLGGPIIVPHFLNGRNRLFFFLANDNLILDQPNTTTESYVPDASVLQGAYSAYAPWLKIFPAGNGGQVPGTPSWDYFNASYPFLIRGHTTSARLDWQLPRSIRVFFRTNIAPSSSVAPSISGEAVFGEGSHVSIDTYTGGATVPLGVHIVDEWTLNYTGDNTQFLESVASVGGNSPNALQGNLPSGVNSSLDGFAFDPEATSTSNAYAIAQIGPVYRNALHQWNVVDTLTLQRGQHAIKVGIDFLSRLSILREFSNYYRLIVNTGTAAPYATEDIDTGLISSLETIEVVANPNISLSNTSLFVNDDWKVAPSLTLNGGLRWELDPAPTVGPLGDFAVVGDDLNPLTFQAALSTAPLYGTVHTNFAPRFGFAWSPPTHSGTVLRGGVGIYFDTGQAATTAGTNGANNYPYQYTQTYSEVPYASVNWTNLGGTQGSMATSPLYLVDPNLLTPRTYEWSLTVDQSFDRSAMLTASYVGNDGERLVGEDAYYNGVNAAGQYPVNTTYVRKRGYLYIVTNQSHSNYQALQAQLTLRMGQWVSALTSYTWGHAEDNGSTDFSSVGAAALNPIANSANDVRQMFATAIHFAPKGLTENRLVRAVTGGWGLDTIARLQSASPLTVTYSNSTDDNVNDFTTNADVVAGVPTVLHEHIDSYGNDVPGNKLLNWAAFTAPPTDPSGVQLRNGDSPTNGYRLFGLTQWDLAASRTWKIWEGLNLSFRVDTFNLLNTANFAQVATGWSSSGMASFGLSDATYASQYGGNASGYGSTGAQLSVFQNGGPRELQLSMKLKF